MTAAQPPRIVAVDGGGSTCRAQLMRRDGPVLGRATGGRANITTDLPGATQTIRATIAAAYRDAALDPAAMAQDVAHLGLAGANVGAAGAQVAQSLAMARVEVTSDQETTVEGTLGGADGVVAQLGTGSFFSVRAGGRIRHRGGWGFQLSDECSGAALGRDALRAAVAAYDGLGPESALTAALLARHGGAPGPLVSFVQTAAPGDFAAVVPELLRAEGQGDAVAAGILGAATARLVEILDALGAGAATAPRLCLVGGLGETYRARLPQRYAARCVDPAGGPLEGAHALALRWMQAPP